MGGWESSWLVDARRKPYIGSLAVLSLLEVFVTDTNIRYYSSGVESKRFGILESKRFGILKGKSLLLQRGSHLQYKTAVADK